MKQTRPSLMALQGAETPRPNILGAPQVQDRGLSDPNWRKYFDMLNDAGVGGLATAEASDMNDPTSKLHPLNTRQLGFFDTQGRGRR